MLRGKARRPRRDAGLCNEYGGYLPEDPEFDEEVRREGERGREERRGSGRRERRERERIIY